MDGETIFYIVVAIVYFAVSIMNSRRKAREKKLGKGKQRPVAPKQPQPAHTDPTLEDIIGKLFGEEEKAVQPAKPVVEPISSKEFQRQQELAEQARVAEQRNRERRQEMITHRNKMKKAKLRTKGESEKEERPAGKIFSNVSLRDAVIAQAILDRPYK